MNGPRQNHQTHESSPRWIKIPGATPCRHGLRSVPQSQRSSAAAAARYSPAIRRRQQWSSGCLFQVPAHAWMVFRGYRLKGSQRTGGLTADRRNQERNASQSGDMVRANLVVVRLVTRYGFTTQSVPARRVRCPVVVPKIARLTPSHGVARQLIAPSHGVEGGAATPSHGAMRGIFRLLLTPSHGAYLDITICRGTQWTLWRYPTVD